MSLDKFHQLTKEEATAIVKKIAKSSKSEEQIRRELTKAGFNGLGAAVTTHSSQGMFMAMVMVWGPHGEIISV